MDLDGITYTFYSQIEKDLLRDWLELLGQLPSHSFYHRPEWFSSHINSRKDSNTEIFFLCINKNDQPCCIIPLEYIPAPNKNRERKIWTLYWKNDMGINDAIYTPAIGHKLLIDTLKEALNSKAREYPWNYILCQNLPDRSLFHEAIVSRNTTCSLSVYHHDSKSLATADNFDSATANIKTKFLRNNRRKRNKLSKTGEISCQLSNKSSDLNLLLEQFISIESSNWKGHKGTSLKDDHSQREFYYNIIKNFTPDQCRFHTLYLNQKPIASQLALETKETFHLLKIGYDDSYRNISPGNILLEETIRHFSTTNRKIKSIDFVTGSKWNDDWAPHITKVYTDKIYNHNMGGLIHCFKDHFINLLRQIKHKIKK